MENKQPIFASGLFFTKPRDKAPSWVKGQMSVEVEKFTQFMKEQIEHISPKGYLNLTLKESKGGQTLYFEVDTWKPLEKPSFVEEKKAPEWYPEENINPDDIPF